MLATVSRLLALVLCTASLAAAPLQAQNQGLSELQRSRQRLDSIRAERQRLEAQQERLEGQVRDVNADLRNIERQRETTNRIVNEIETQLAGLNSELGRVSGELALAEDNLEEKQAVLERRLIEIYKRGRMYTFQALLAAESFGDLLARYKYLYLTSRQDRALVADVEALNARVRRQRNDLLGIRASLGSTREDRARELKRYADLANARARRLAQLQRSGQATGERLTQLEQDEARLNELLVALERARRNAATTAAPIAGGLTTEDIGKLDWPVNGRVVYNFGPTTLPNGVKVRYNGIGIGATEGTPVKAVENGRVELVQRIGTYGLTVVVQHGNGYRSLYMQLKDAGVSVGQDVTRGEVIGTVGGANSEQGAHLHFEIRGENSIALDPSDWLRRRR
ncbi:MAG TPA: peptidoglycan DD-metalloendopeptidase family protein [Gemmatimonadales bacterium]|nr:peptidoglycan DD-metalloendopeptidase family protein [Gemmatimonadales bacterium]